EHRRRVPAWDERSRDVVANHGTLRGERDIGQRRRTRERRRRSPVLAAVRRGDEPRIELTAAGARGIRIEVIRERQVRASPRGRLVDAQARDEVIGAARDGVDWYALDG